MVSVVQANGRQRIRAPPSSRQSLLCLARTFGDDLQIGSRRGIRLAAALFPILQDRERDAVDAGEFLLGHPQLSPDGAHIGHFDDMNSDPAGLSLGMFASLGQAFDQFLGARRASGERSSRRVFSKIISR
jgi:hypothetical protein